MNFFPESEIAKSHSSVNEFCRPQFGRVRGMVAIMRLFA
jgi:hypothetical protein